MELRLLKKLAVRVTNADNEEEEPRSEILCDGLPTGRFVNGAILEAAIQWRDWYLVLLTNNIPHEDSLNIYLLDKHFNEIDSAVMFWMYSTGTFESLELIEPNAVQFRFFGDTTWTIELLPKPAFRLPLITEPCGVWRRWGFSRHFKVHGNPRPEARTSRRN